MSFFPKMTFVNSQPSELEQEIESAFLEILGNGIFGFGASVLSPELIL